MIKLLETCKVPVYYHWSAFLFFILAFPYIHESFIEISNDTSLRPTLFSILAYFGIVGGILFHEIGHVIVAQYYKIPVSAIYLQFFGGISLIEKSGRTLFQQLAIAFAGPFFSLIFSGIFYIIFNISQYLPISDSGVFLFKMIFFIHLVIGLMNLCFTFMPADGGRVLRAAFGILTNKYLLGWRLSCYSSFVFFGIVIYYTNFSVFYIIFSLFFVFVAMVALPREGEDYLDLEKLNKNNFIIEKANPHFTLTNSKGMFLGTLDIEAVNKDEEKYYYKYYDQHGVQSEYFLCLKKESQQES